MKVKLTRASNAAYYKVAENDIVDIPLEDYLRGVVASEIGNAPLEACKAQAVASGTVAYLSYSKDKAISDSSSTAQAFRADRINGNYPNAYRAVQETIGEILSYQGQVINSCPFCHANGGRTVSSKERWGGERAWLTAKNDPWDDQPKSGHGVGMSQCGAIKAAENGLRYTQILAFYYPGTSIMKEGGDDMEINVYDLIAVFETALKNKWGYIYGAAGELWTQAKQKSATRQQTIKWGKRWIGKTVVDCSGLFAYAFKKLGGYMYHGSNTMFKKYCTSTGELLGGKRTDGKELKPGTSVYKYNKTEGYHHVGLYIGDGRVIEAKGTYYGVVESKISEWSHWGELKGVAYSAKKDVEAAPYIQQKKMFGIVIGNGNLNLRRSPNRNASRIAYIKPGTKIEILKTASTDPTWYFVQYGKEQGYVDGAFIELG